MGDLSSVKKQSVTLKSKYTLTLLLFIFTLLFYRYSPFAPEHTNNNSLLQTLFNLYFFISNQTLGIVHESGHGVCYLLPCPKFITALNGTLFQVAFPLFIYFYYRYKKRDFLSYIGIYFTGFSLQYTAWYISTSYRGAYVSASDSFLGVDGYHDFYYILDTLGVLNHYEGIATFVKVVAYILMFGSVVLMFLNGFMSKSKEETPPAL